MRGKCSPVRPFRYGRSIPPPRKRPCDRSHSAVDFFAVSHAEDEDNQAVVLDLADEPIITHAVLPKFAEPRLDTNIHATASRAFQWTRGVLAEKSHSLLQMSATCL